MHPNETITSNLKAVSMGPSKRQPQQVLRASSVSMTAPQPSQRLPYNESSTAHHRLPPQNILHSQEVRNKQFGHENLLNAPKTFERDMVSAAYQASDIQSDGSRLSNPTQMSLKPSSEYAQPSQPSTIHQLPNHLKGKSLFPKISSRSEIRYLSHRSAVHQTNNSKLITIIMPQNIPNQRYSNQQQNMGGLSAPTNQLAQIDSKAISSSTPNKPPASVILKKLSNQNRNYVGKHSQAFQDTTPRFGAKQQKTGAVRTTSQDYQNLSNLSQTPNQMVGSLSPGKVRNAVSMNSSDVKSPENMLPTEGKEYSNGEHGSAEDRSSTEGTTTNFISRRKDSATSAVTQTQAQKAFTKQKRVSFRHGPLRGIRIGDKADMPPKQTEKQHQNQQDEFSLNGEGLIPTHILRQSYAPQTAPSNKRMLSSSIQESRDFDDDPYSGSTPESQHQALRQILNYHKQEKGSVSPENGSLVWALDSAFSPPISPTSRNSFSQQQIQYLLNYHKNLASPGQAVLAMEGGIQVPATLFEGREYFPSPPKPLLGGSKVINAKGHHVRRSYNYSSSVQGGPGSYFNTYVQSPMSGRIKDLKGSSGIGGSIPLVSSHLSKITPEQCLSLNSAIDAHHGSLLSTQQQLLLQSLKMSEQLREQTGGNYLLEMPNLGEKRLVQSGVNTNSDVTLPELDSPSLQCLQTYPELSPSSYSEEEKQKAKQDLVQKHKTVCPFHKKLIWLSLGQPLKQSTVQGIRKFRNKNPNCNHNNNSVLYQPLLSANKLEEILKHKEEALKNLYFGTGISEAKAAQLGPFKARKEFKLELSPLKVGGGSLADSPKTDRNQESSSQNQVMRGSTSSPDIRLSKLKHKTKQDRNTSEAKYDTVPKEIKDLEKAAGRHKHFLYALLRVNKIVKENFQRILQDVRALSQYRNDHCIFCYSVLPISILFFSGFVSSQQTSASGALSTGVVSISLLLSRQANKANLNSPSLSHKNSLASTVNNTNFERNLNIVKFLGSIFPRPQQQYKTPQKQPQPSQPSSQAAGSSKKKSQTKQKGQGSNTKKEKFDLKDKRMLLKLGDKDKLLQYREHQFRQFLKKMNEANGLIVSTPTVPFQAYKCYVGRGNNSILVRMAFKQRWWWSLAYKEEWENYNFAWTQWKSNKMIATLKKHHEVVGGDATSSLITSASSTSSCGVSSNISNQGSSNKLLEQTSSSQNLQTAETSSTSAGLKSAKIQEGEASRRATSSVQPKKRITSSSLSSHRGTMRSTSSEREETSRKSERKSKKDAHRDLLKETAHTQHISNHIECHYHLSNKKALFLNMRLYYDALNEDMFQYMPVTFHLKEGADSKEWDKFEECYTSLQNEIEQQSQEPQEVVKEEEQASQGQKKANFPEKEALMKQKKKKSKNMWIVKPGENTNRGFGIIVARDLAHIKELISHQVRLQNGNKRSYIVQKYIDRPLLFHRRKFDIRCYAMVTSINGNVRGYFYQDGYFRTACKEFSTKNITNRFIHLTNDAIQKRHEDYGKFESGNKLSYNDFQRYMDNYHPEMKLNMMKEIIPRIRKIVTDTIKATYKKIDPNRRHHSFEIFGYDFMVDEDKKVLLIEVNTNPCLELSCPLLARLIPQMIENGIRLAVDPLFPPPQPWPNSKKHHIPDIESENKFELVFDEATDAQELNNLPFHNAPIGEIIEEEEEENELSGSEDDNDDL